MTRVTLSEFADLFEKPAFAHLATLMPDGTPQVTPVWVDYDGTFVVINVAKGRLKDRNMRARPQVAIDIVDPDNPYRYVAVRGRVVEISEEGADLHLDRLSQRYLSRNFPWYHPDQVRCIIRIAPESISGQHLNSQIADR